jgi:hypothetical protein
MRKLLFVIISIIFASIGQIHAQEEFRNSETSVKKIYKTKHIYSIECKTYTILNNEKIALYGAKERKFVNDNVYWGEAGYGAVFGQRSGYLEGGLIFGYQAEFSSIFILDMRLFVGAGGGGSAIEGAGLIVNPTIGLGIKIAADYSIFIETGYIKFPSDPIGSQTFAINLNVAKWSLTCD